MGPLLARMGLGIVVRHADMAAQVVHDRAAHGAGDRAALLPPLRPVPLLAAAAALLPRAAVVPAAAAATCLLSWSTLGGVPAT
jgi:hypothetical protein